MNELRIATRQSPLALWQARHAAALLEAAHPDLAVSLLPMSTRGDEILDRTLDKIGGKGLFLKELETALLDGRADIAVHSMKDVPAVLPDGLHIAAVLERENPHDAFVSLASVSFDALPPQARVGTSSLRRRCQLLALRQDVHIEPVRGNVHTRLARLDDGDFDALILAHAGLDRLRLGTRIRETLSAEVCVPAIGQGVIGIECRRGDTPVEALLAAVNHPLTERLLTAERALGRRLGGSCQAPVAGHAVADASERRLALTGLVGEPDGREIVRGVAGGDIDDGVAVGEGLAGELLARGAGDILARLKDR